MTGNDAQHTPAWFEIIETVGLVRGGLLVWLVGLAALSLNLGFRMLALLSALGAVALAADAYRRVRLARRAHSPKLREP